MKVKPPISTWATVQVGMDLKRLYKITIVRLGGQLKNKFHAFFKEPHTNRCAVTNTCKHSTL